MRNSCRILYALLVAIVFVVGSAAAWTERTTGAASEVLMLKKGRSTVIEADRDFSTIVVADPEIADAMATSSRSFFLRGKNPGTTTVLIYGRSGDIAELIDVEVELGLDELRMDLRSLLPGENINVFSVHDGIFLDGQLTTAAAAQMAMQIAERYAPGGVANGLTVGKSQQVLLEVRFLEAGRNLVKEIGAGSSINANDVVMQTEGGTVSGALEKSILTFTNLGGANIDLTLRALEEKGVVRTLAEPNLIALSGDTASFLAGGEFPIPVSSSQGEISVEFKKFGISLDFTPTVLGAGLVNIHVRPEVSALDRNNGIRANDIDIPGVSVRRAETTVELYDGQAFAIAGLLKNEYTNEVRQTPWLGNVPVLGLLFSSKRYQRNETELVIIVVPRLVQPASHPDLLRTPLDAIDEASQEELFIFNKTAPLSAMH